MQETPVWFLGGEDLLEKKQAAHSSILGLPFWLSWQRICLQMQETWVRSLGLEDPWRREQLHTPVFWPLEFHGLYGPWGRKESYMIEWLTLGFPGGLAGKESACNVGDLGSIPGLGRSSGEGNSYALKYSCLENPMDKGAWWATVHGVAKSWTRLSD